VWSLGEIARRHNAAREVEVRRKTVATSKGRPRRPGQRPPLPASAHGEAQNSPANGDSIAPEWVFFTYTMAVALNAVLHRYNPGIWNRVLTWAREAENEYRVRTARDGPLEACHWLLQEAQNPRLPDLRARRSASCDSASLKQYYKLQDELKPVFARHQSPRARREAAAPIVSAVVGRHVRPDDLPDSRRLEEFCQDALKLTPVRVSRMRRRQSDTVAQYLDQAAIILEATSSQVGDKRQKARRVKVAREIREHLARRAKRPRTS
jgi:hypothetical protein